MFNLKHLSAFFLSSLFMFSCSKSEVIINPKLCLSMEKNAYTQDELVVITNCSEADRAWVKVYEFSDEEAVNSETEPHWDAALEEGEEYILKGLPVGDYYVEIMVSNEQSGSAILQDRQDFSVCE